MTVRSTWALALTGIILASRLWFAGHRAIDLDEYEHAHAAWSVAQGQVPYVDFYEHHTPALYLLAAPLFGLWPAATDADAAVRTLVAARLAMWILAVGSVALTYRLGARWRTAEAAAIAALLLATSAQFVDSMLEFRPDVAAVCGLLVSVLCVTGGDRKPETRARWIAAGAAFALACLFTQKVVFAAPGLLAAVLAGRRALARLAWLAIGAALPLLCMVWWFQERHALGGLYFYNVVDNLRLNGDRLPPLPRLVSNVVQQPAIYLLGAVGLFRALRTPLAQRDRVAVPATAASLAAGIFVVGRAHDQYYALLLPLLAVLGAGVAVEWWSAPAADRRATDGRAPIVGAAMAGVVAICVFNLARTYRSNAEQLAAIRWVTTNTEATDSYIGGSPGAAVFRPHAWFYFFLTGPFASDRDYAALLADLEADRVRPRIAIDDAYLARAPEPLLAYVRSHYRRQNEYGSEGLKIRDASDRLDRPFTR